MEVVFLILQIASPVIALASTAVSIALYRAAARRKELDALGGRISEVERERAADKEAGQTSRSELRERLVEVEQRLSNMPDRQAVHDLAIAITEIRGSVATQGETLKSVAATASRVEHFLLAGKVP